MKLWLVAILSAVCASCVSVDDYRAEKRRVEVLEKSRSYSVREVSSVLSLSETVNALQSSILSSGGRVHSVIETKCSFLGCDPKFTPGVTILFGLEEETALISEDPRVAQEFPGKFLIGQSERGVLVRFSDWFLVFSQYDLETLSRARMSYVTRIFQILNTPGVAPEFDEPRRLD